MRGDASLLLLLLTLAGAPQPVHANAAATAPERDPIQVLNWNQAQLRGAYSAYRLLGTRAHGPGGDPLGEVHDILVNAAGTVTAIVVEGGGVLGIGERQYRVPWQALQFARDGEHVTIPAEESPAGLRPGEWRITELLDDAVELDRGVPYGNVVDILIAPRGEVRAILVDGRASGPPGPYAFPWARERFERDRDVHPLPYERRQIEHLKPFDYSALEIPAPPKDGE